MTFNFMPWRAKEVLVSCRPSVRQSSCNASGDLNTWQDAFSLPTAQWGILSAVLKMIRSGRRAVKHIQYVFRHSSLMLLSKELQLATASNEVTFGLSAGSHSAVSRLCVCHFEPNSGATFKKCDGWLNVLHGSVQEEQHTVFNQAPQQSWSIFIDARETLAWWRSKSCWYNIFSFTFCEHGNGGRLCTLIGHCHL